MEIVGQVKQIAVAQVMNALAAAPDRGKFRSLMMVNPHTLVSKYVARQPKPAKFSVK